MSWLKTWATSYGIRLRIVSAFGALAIVTALGGMTVREAHERAHQNLDRVEELDLGIRATLRLSAAVRDLHARQVQVILLNNTSALSAYEGARRVIASDLTEARHYACGIAQCALLDNIEAVISDIDAIFREEILPHVPGDTSTLMRPYARVYHLVDRVVELTDLLAERFSASIESGKSHADFVGDVAAALMLGLIALAIFSVAGIAWYADRRIALPLRTLSEATRRIAAGDLTTLVRVERQDEVGNLAAHFNDMAAKLAAEQTKFMQAEKLAGIGRVAAGIAHEINNPLAVILGYAKLIAEGSADPTNDAQIILREVDRCRDIVNSLLDFARPARLRLNLVSLRSIIDEVAMTLATLCGEGAVQADVRDELWAEVDEGKIRQILINLLRNGIEASPQKTVSVRAYQKTDKILIEVVDTGPGVSQNARAQLFEPFFTTKDRGTGLGLAGSRALAQAHGGCLDYVVQPTSGAKFVLTLPSPKNHGIAITRVKNQ